MNKNTLHLYFRSRSLPTLSSVWVVFSLTFGHHYGCTDETMYLTTVWYNPYTIFNYSWKNLWKNQYAIIILWAIESMCLFQLRIQLYITRIYFTSEICQPFTFREFFFPSMYIFYVFANGAAVVLKAYTCCMRFDEILLCLFSIAMTKTSA